MNLMALAQQGFAPCREGDDAVGDQREQLSIVTGEYPSAHGISSNYRTVRETGEDIYMESGEYILSETLQSSARARWAPGRSFRPRRTTAHAAVRRRGYFVRSRRRFGRSRLWESRLRSTRWTSTAGIRAASHAMKLESADIVYISTTDFAMHTYALDEPESQQHVPGRCHW